MEDILACCSPLNEDQKPTVTIKPGKLSGKARETRGGEKTEYIAFTSIPFAEPPCGHLRFRKPVAKIPWPGVLEATKRCPTPLQIARTGIGCKIIGSEDCLYLNVFTPDIPVTENQRKLPVIVCFFGSWFTTGTCRDDIFSPDNFMETQEVVLVTVNYRLGPFGFICLGLSECPGNQGLWDQLLALQWIKDNIAAFGGDENNVTLIGHGSGSVSASYHLISPKSIGYFARVVMMSGTFVSPINNLPYHALEVAKSLADICNVHQDEDRDILEGLKRVPGAFLLEKGCDF